MRAFVYVAVLSLMLPAFNACGTRSYKDAAPYGGAEEMYAESVAYADEAGMDGEGQPQTGGDLFAAERKIVKTAEIRFQVADLAASTKNIEALAQKHGGYISGMNQTNSRYSIDNRLTVKIPSEAFSPFLQEIEKESVFTNYKRINSQDVTEEYVDVAGRLKTKKEVMGRYMAILKEKAKTVKDILEAEEKIRVIQEEIESMEGRLKYLNERVVYSTVSVEIYREVDYVEVPELYRKPFLAKLKEGFVGGWLLIQDMVVGLVYLWPLLLLLALLLYFFGGRLRRFLSRKGEGR